MSENAQWVCEASVYQHWIKSYLRFYYWWISIRCPDADCDLSALFSGPVFTRSWRRTDEDSEILKFGLLWELVDIVMEKGPWHQPVGILPSQCEGHGFLVPEIVYWPSKPVHWLSYHDVILPIVRPEYPVVCNPTRKNVPCKSANLDRFFGLIISIESSGSQGLTLPYSFEE